MVPIVRACDSRKFSSTRCGAIATRARGSAVLEPTGEARAPVLGPSQGLCGARIVPRGHLRVPRTGETARWARLAGASRC
jgi:hypothetical protein